ERWLADSRSGTIGGTAYFSGDLAGTTANPQLAGTLDLYAAHLGELRLDYGSGRIAASRRAVTFDPERGFIARLYPAELRLSGEIREPTSSRPQLHLTASINDLEVGRFLATTDEEPVLTGVA